MILEGTLTGFPCDNKSWQGVEVWGGDGSQYPIGGVSAQGRLDTRSGAVISNALTAVKLYGPTSNEAGGQIFSTGTTFINNEMAVEFASFSNFWPYATSQQGQPRNYFGRFTDCNFITDNSYALSTPFEVFIAMTDVNGIRFLGCDFINSQGLTASNIEAYGWGIRASESGFTVDARCTGNTYPCNSFDRGHFVGLGYGVQITNANEIRPYTIKQIDFEDCYIGLYNNGVSNATLLNNNFMLGNLPHASASNGDQIGVILEMGLAGFTLQENNFVGVVGNATHTAGTICRDLGEFNNEIRRNNYSDLDIGNLGQGDNATSPLEGDERGLTYLCNNNSATIDDFAVGGLFGVNRIRQSQGVSEEIAGQIVYSASGNRFTPIGTGEFVNDGQAIRYYFNNQVEEILGSTTGSIETEIADENTCTVIYCEPPCKTDEEIALEKANYYENKTRHTTAKTEQQAAEDSGDTALAESKGKEASYYQQQMDQEAYMVVLHTVHDTLQFNEDTLAVWVENLNVFSMDITWALRQQSAGNYHAAQAALDRITKRTDLDRQDQKDLGDMPLLMEALRGRAPHEVASRHFKDLEELAIDPHSFTGNIAKNILRNHGYYFPPIYHFPQAKIGHTIEGLSSTSVAERATFKVFPNPNKGQLTVEWQPADELATTGQLTIRDLSGRPIRENSVLAYGQQFIDLKDQPAGVYFYQFEIPEHDPIVGKIIIQ